MIPIFSPCQRPPQEEIEKQAQEISGKINALMHGYHMTTIFYALSKSIGQQTAYVEEAFVPSILGQIQQGAIIEYNNLKGAEHEQI